MDNLGFEKRYKTEGFVFQRRYPNEQVIQFLASHYFSLPRSKRRKIKVLELGCGSGANLWMIAKEGFDTYGIDLAPTSIDLCKQMLASYGVKAHVSVGNMKHPNFRSAFFDAIVDVVSVQHTNVKGHQEAYDNIFRCLKKGGRFFSWHLGSKSINFTHGGGKKLDRYTVDNTPRTTVPYPNVGILCFLTAPLAKRLLKASGFVDIHIERVTRTYKDMTQKVEFFAINVRKP